jgi:hypothetical protein
MTTGMSRTATELPQCGDGSRQHSLQLGLVNLTAARRVQGMPRSISCTAPHAPCNHAGVAYAHHPQINKMGQVSTHACGSDKKIIICV